MIGRNGAAPGPLAVGDEPPPLHTPRPTGPNRPPPSRGSPKGKRSSKGRFECINAFLDVTLAGLDRAELATWLILWRDTKPDGLARTSQSDLARWAGCAPPSVRRALTALSAAGHVTVVRQGGLHRGLSVYRLAPLPADRPPRQRTWASGCKRTWVCAY